jgi:hypothetical protein
MGILPSQIRFQYLALAVAVCVAASLSFAGLLPAYHCPFATFLGVSCPMCGTTRAWLNFIHGDIRGAFVYNPLFLVWGFWCLVAFADLVHKAVATRTPTIGERCIRAVARNGVLRVAHFVCFALVLFYVNAVGPTATGHVCIGIQNAVHR